jgi:hypothetical protein
MIINSGKVALSPSIRTQQSGPPSTQTPIQRPREGLASGIDKLAETVMDTGFFAFNEVAEVAKNDPALALRYGATTISEKLLEGVGQNVRDGFGKAIIPTIRLSILGANAYRMNRTFKDPGSHLLEKGLDVARVATDILGFAGSILKYVMPSKAALGDTLVGISYAADTVSHSARLLTHGAQRVTVWKKALAERKEAKAKHPTGQQPVTEPAPGPVAMTAAQAFGSNVPSVLLQQS